MKTKTDSLRQLIVDAYLAIDRRSLALTRVALGTLLLGDLARRTPDWLAMYGAKGVLPSSLILARPGADGYSLFTAFDSPTELWALWAFGLCVYLALLVGYKTKVAQVLSLAFVTSMNGRVLLIENGGYVVQNLLLLWTCFLPLGDRYSVDALLRSMRARRERTIADLNDRAGDLDARLRAPHVSLVGLVIVLQLSAVYFFNVVHKTGPAWANGTAVHFVLYNDRMATPIIALVRDHVPLSVVQLLTRGTLAIEAGLVLLLLSPIARVWAKRGVFFGMIALHTGFGSTFTLGPFAWSCNTFATLFVSREDWELARKTMRREHRARTVELPASSGAALFFARLVKRADRFRLLTFEEAPGDRFATVDARGERRFGALALADIVDAFPLGPIVAWPLRLPGLRWIADASIASVAKLPLDAWFGFAAIDRRNATTLPKTRATRTPVVVPILRELAIAVMLAAAVNQALVELWVARPLHAGQPEPLRSLTHKARFLQGWFMFSPNPVMDDGTIVVDAITIDGRHVDPFTDAPPNFDLPHAKSLRLNQIWGDYFNRIRLPGNSGYRDAMRDYMLRLPERTGRADDAIVSGKVYWIQDMNPALGKTESTNFEKLELFSFEAPQRVSSR